MEARPDAASPAGASGWGSDFFGTLNDLPDPAVHTLADVLEAMNSEPAFRLARQTLLRQWQLPESPRVLEAGCGTGVALEDLVQILPSGARVVGIDPTRAFIEAARRRAAAGGHSHVVTYATGDVRSLPYPEGSFDAAFCDKVLLHVGPPEAVLAELVRVVRPGGWVGAVEWQPAFALSTTRPDVLRRFGDMLRQAVYDYHAGPNLPRYFHAVGLTEAQTGVFLAHGDNLDHPPFWRAFLVHQLPLFVQAGLLSAEDAQGLAHDLDALNARGEFRGSFVVYMAVARKRAGS